MSKPTKYGFLLAQSKGYTPNYGYIKVSAFSDEDALQVQHTLKPGEIIYYVDAEKFSIEKATEIADQKAQELFGKDPAWLKDFLEASHE